MEIQTILLPNGQSMPIVGFGTWQASGDELEHALDMALEAGYRHIDTAPVYFNENIIGKVLRKWFDAGKIKRSEIFIVTKLPPSGHRPERVEMWIKRSLKDLQLDYVDLYLIHTPFSFEYVEGDLHPVDDNGQIKLDLGTNPIATWIELEKQVTCGRAKAIGLSNFNMSQIDRIVKVATVPVSMLQIELHLHLQQKELVKYCKEKNISVTAYSPLGSRGLVKQMNKAEEIPDILQNSKVLELAKNYNKSPAQILLRYAVQNGIVVIPKSTNPKRIRENIELFGWELKSEDMIALASFDLGPAGRICDFLFFKGIKQHPEYPF